MCVREDSVESCAILFSLGENQPKSKSSVCAKASLFLPKIPPTESQQEKSEVMVECM